MSSCLEATKRTLSFQAKSVAYLEKHRIYELFHELATELVIKQPEDPYLFIKQHLDRIAKKRDIPRIILIAPPNFDVLRLAKVLKTELQIRIFSLKDLKSNTVVDPNEECQCDEPKDLALKMKNIIECSATHSPGWILVGMPRTKKEARIFQQFGIIPTHVFQIIPSSNEDKESCTPFFLHSSDDQSSSFDSLDSAGRDSELYNYSRNLRGLREAFANLLIEVEVGVRTIGDLGKDCAKLAKRRKHYGAPLLFRIVLIGSRGSGCTTQAKYLSKRFDLVHIDYDYIAEQARLQQTALGQMLRLCQCKFGEQPKPEIRIQIIEKYVTRYDCLKKGWILTGYPKTVEDFKLLDLIPTPPNRVVFMTVRRETCRQRLLNRRYNISTGSIHIMSSQDPSQKTECKFATHPRDYESVVDRDLQEYEENISRMMEYAGDTAFKIDGNSEERTVRERLECCLICPTPSSNPRNPRPSFPKTDIQDIEFKADADLDPSEY